MGAWTLVVEAGASGLSAAAVEGGETVPLAIDVDGDTLTEAFGALAGARPTEPGHLIMVVPGDVSSERFTDLAEAAALAGLPDPSWLPDAVARVGDTLAAEEPGTPVLVIDARTSAVVAWPVRPTVDGVRIAATGAHDLGRRVDELLAGLVHAKLAHAAPAYAVALRERRDAPARRDAAHLARELRRVRRLLDDEDIVVAVDGVEVSIGPDEFVHVVRHAVTDVRRDADHATVVHVLADGPGPMVDRLVVASGGVTHVADGEPGSSLRGTAALIRPRAVPPAATDVPPPTSVPAPHPAAGPAQAGRSDRRRRWAVPTLSTLLVLSMSAAVGVLVVGPARVAGLVAIVSETDAPAPTRPIGFDRP